MRIASRVSSPVRSDLTALRAELHRLEPGLSSASERYRGGLLLMALSTRKPKIDHLAALLELPREFVARCVRRLFDNGVLQHDGLVTGWSGSEMVAEPFWADVNVALGLWWRRQDLRGNIEWIEAGRWHKHYDYVSAARSEPARTSYIAGSEARPQMNLDCFQLPTAVDSCTWIGSGAGAATAISFETSAEESAISRRFDSPSLAERLPGGTAEVMALAPDSTTEVVWLF